MTKFLLAAFLAVAASPCMADWYAQYMGGNFQGQITYNGNTATATESMTSAGYSPGPLSALTNQVYLLPNKLWQSLDSDVRTAAASEGVSFVSSNLIIPSTGVRMSLAGLTGTNTGLNQAILSGPTYSAKVHGSKSIAGISVSCDETLTVSNVVASIAYQPYSGIVSTNPSLTYVALHPTTSTSCTNSLDWIPILGSLIDQLAQSYVGSKTSSDVITNYANAALSSAIPKGPDYLGIYQMVPPGKYVISPGTPYAFDVGQYLKNNFASLFAGRTLSVTFNFNNTPLRGTGVNPPIYNTTTATPLFIDFLDPNTHLTLKVTDNRSYSWHYVTTCQGPSCTKLP